MQEHHITTPGPVLDAHGVITPGYSERSICTYRRADLSGVRRRKMSAAHLWPRILCRAGGCDAVQL